MNVLGAILIMLVLVALGIVTFVVWAIWDYQTNPLWHRTFCTCGRCKEEDVRKAVEYSEWSRHQDETRRAVEEMERSARGH